VRIVSLCPSITESLVSFGLAGDLVGVTRYCIHPREVVRDLRKVGGTKNPDLAAIRALAPDLVFANSEENRAPDVAALSADFAVDVSHPRTARDVPDLLRRFGRLTAREAEAEAWARRIEAALAPLSTAPAAAFTYAYLVWRDPWMTVGEGTYVADLLRIAGGVNVFAAREGDYPAVSDAEIVEARPEVLLLPDEPFPFREKDRAFWSERLPSSDVRLVSGDDFCWHGVRTVRGLAAAAALREERAAARP
jgi:ABC-type Fe3+-hydroxamate transport system substrate-binding protein